MSDKFYSIKELAEKFGVSKTAIHRYLTDDFRAKYVETVNRNEFKECLQKGRKGLIEVPKLKGEGMAKSPFVIEEVGHFDDELHKPLMIVKMFDE